jgi:hypothetical protein
VLVILTLTDGTNISYEWSLGRLYMIPCRTVYPLRVLSLIPLPLIRQANVKLLFIKQSTSLSTCPHTFLPRFIALYGLVAFLMGHLFHADSSKLLLKLANFSDTD